MGEFGPLKQVRNRISELESENETLRDALQQIAQIPYQSGRARGDVAIEIARAALATPDTPLGEYHAEGLDERGIYGGRAYPAAPDTPPDA